MKIYESLKGKDVVCLYLQIKSNWAYFEVYPVCNCETRSVLKQTLISALMALNPDGVFFVLFFQPRAWEQFFCIGYRISKGQVVLKVRYGPAVLGKG